MTRPGHSIRHGLTGLALTAFALVPAPPALSQVPVVFRGRVEDAVSRSPIAGARIAAPDSSAVYADSLGRFEIPGLAGEPFFVDVQQYGYTPQRFDFPAEATTRLLVLLLQPTAIELEGVSIVAESAVAEQTRDLQRRRNRYFGPVRAFGREQLDRFFPVGTAWDVVRARAPGLFECDTSTRSGLCVRGRSRSFRNPFPEVPVLVCVDQWESFGAITELESLDVRGVALVEIYGGGSGGIRVYTAGFLASSARTGRYVARPLEFGC